MSTFSVYLRLSASGSPWLACLLRPKADEWRLVHIRGLSCSDPLDHGKKRSCERSPVAVTKPRTSHSRIIACIPRLRQDRSCGILVGGKGGCGDVKHTTSCLQENSQSFPLHTGSGAEMWGCLFALDQEGHRSPWTRNNDSFTLTSITGLISYLYIVLYVVKISFSVKMPVASHLIPSKHVNWANSLPLRQSNTLTRYNEGIIFMCLSVFCWCCQF